MYTSIVVGTDGSATANLAVQQASELARMCDATLHLVTAYRVRALITAAAESPMLAAAALDCEHDMARQAAVALDATADRLRRSGVRIESHACPGEAADALLEVAEQEKADLIVVGSRGMQGARRFLGSVPNSVAHRSPTTVMIVRTC